MENISAFGCEKVYHTLFLCIDIRTVVDSEKLAASILKILYHHSPELIVGIYHLVIHESCLRCLSEEIEGPI